MFTQCPSCQKTYPLTVEELRAGRGMMSCRNCSARFDALEFISETAAGPSKIIFSSPLIWEQKKASGTVYWNAGLIIGLVLFIAQIGYFEHFSFSQNPAFRPWLIKICGQIKCVLPAYEKPDEFAVAHGSLVPLPHQAIAFRAVITNQAAFTQAYPDLKLTLFSYTGEPFARRTFRPLDYLPAASGSKFMASDETAEIGLNIAAPKTKTGGYTFELI
ncbi:MAG: zinc-ribbon and DUF3426 domain-containing protein [Methylobacter sp.]|nr:zinc-ribbon and DUF3426 domain-containing protein [Methylobacter sp.]